MVFQYSSTQVHEVMENGEKKMKKNIVEIKNGKGSKTVELTENGKTRKSTKKLSNAEIQKIQQNQFIPGLFKSCTNCLNSRSLTSQTRRNSKKKRDSRK
jgi:hypothetical protein